jgi:hypothetical protein
VRHRGLEVIEDAALVEAIARTPADHFVIWTGHACGAQAGSLRSRALACVREVASPVPLRTLLQRAARLAPEGGLCPDVVRSAVRIHQAARPAVYLLARRLPSNAYVAVTDVPCPAAGPRRIAAGDVLIAADGKRLFAIAANPEPELARSA